MIDFDCRMLAAGLIGRSFCPGAGPSIDTILNTGDRGTVRVNFAGFAYAVRPTGSTASDARRMIDRTRWLVDRPVVLATVFRSAFSESSHFWRSAEYGIIQYNDQYRRDVH